MSEGLKGPKKEKKKPTTRVYHALAPFGKQHQQHNHERTTARAEPRVDHSGDVLTRITSFLVAFNSNNTWASKGS